jgi:hypothetical protein
MADDLPLFEVTTAAADAASRRLTTAAKVRALIGSPAGDDSKIETLIDGVSADCASFCGLARPANMASPPTFGEEVVKATWLKACRARGSELRLPWRVAITPGQVIEDGTNLTANVDYRLVGGGLLERISGYAPIRWSGGKIVVPYTAGWDLPDQVPPELERQVIEQVKMAYFSAGDDPRVRSEAIPDTYQASYAVAGGDSIGRSGLLLSLESALVPFSAGTVA